MGAVVFDDRERDSYAETLIRLADIQRNVKAIKSMVSGIFWGAVLLAAYLGWKNGWGWW